MKKRKHYSNNVPAKARKYKYCSSKIGDRPCISCILVFFTVLFLTAFISSLMGNEEFSTSPAPEKSIKEESVQNKQFPSTSKTDIPSVSDPFYDSGEIYVYEIDGDYGYGEDEHGNDIEIYIYELDDGFGYGEDELGNEVEFYYDE